MNVVKTDIAGKPLQYARQLVERAALQRRRDVAPVLAALPVNVLKLVLDVKHPNARAAGDHQDDQLDD